MEGDANAHRLVFARQHLPTEQRCHQGGDSLLAVDQDALAGGRRAVLELNRGLRQEIR